MYGKSYTSKFGRTPKTVGMERKSLNTPGQFASIFLVLAVAMGLSSTALQAETFGVARNPKCSTPLCDDPESPGGRYTNGRQFLYIDPPGGTIRQGPGRDTRIRFYLDPGVRIAVTAKQGKWLLIMTDDGRLGWGHRTIFAEAERNSQYRLPPSAMTIKNIDVAKISETEAKVIFELDEGLLPETSVIEGLRPRLVFDFSRSRVENDARVPGRVDNGIIQQVRLGARTAPKQALRVVFDLERGFAYRASQTFYEGINHYVVHIKKEPVM